MSQLNVGEVASILNLGANYALPPPLPSLKYGIIKM